jgi:hypothetical protein
MKRVVLTLAIPLVLLPLLLRPADSSTSPGNRSQKIDLTGVWKVSGGRDDGLEVCIKQSDQSVSANFIYGAPCPIGGNNRDSYFTGAVGGSSLKGELSYCSRSQQLLQDCHFTDPYSVKFEGVITTDTLSVTVHPDYINYDTTKDGHYTNCSVKTGGASPSTFSLQRQRCDQQSACSWQFTRDAIDQAIRKDFQDLGLKLPSYYTPDLIQPSKNQNGIGFVIPMYQNGMPIVIVGGASVTPCASPGGGGIIVDLQIWSGVKVNGKYVVGGTMLGKASGSGDFNQDGLNQALGSALNNANLKNYKSGT